MQGDSKGQFMQNFVNKKKEDSSLKAGLEKEAYAAIGK